MVGDRSEFSGAGGGRVPWTGAVSIFIMSLRLKEMTCRNPAEKHWTGLSSLTNAPLLLPIPGAMDLPERWEKT